MLEHFEEIKSCDRGQVRVTRSIYVREYLFFQSVTGVCPLSQKHSSFRVCRLLMHTATRLRKLWKTFGMREEILYYKNHAKVGGGRMAFYIKICPACPERKRNGDFWLQKIRSSFLA